MSARASRSLLAHIEADTQDAVEVLWAAGDAQRALVLQLLARDSLGVSDLAEILSVPQPALSHHLKILSTSEIGRAHV